MIQFLTRTHKEGTSNPFSIYPYGDDSKDQEMIIQGFKYFDENIERIKEDWNKPIVNNIHSHWTKQYEFYEENTDYVKEEMDITSVYNVPSSWPKRY